MKLSSFRDLRGIWSRRSSELDVARKSAAFERLELADREARATIGCSTAREIEQTRIRGQALAPVSEVEEAFGSPGMSWRHAGREQRRPPAAPGELA